ncbi:hypothetical protein CSC32_3015 [Pseudomonas aeruginosa]|nr:hypothetical protein CSC32_3015 [Pseudomonas aeruginosa]AWF02157.1 hypothetical protein CSC26_4127 [Pseudomonas aeruginosa]RCG86343.1 hypothetical protein CSB86_1720 [Pseudomonas aeruginosa]
MRGVREDGRGHPADLVIGQRVIAAQCRGTGSETGCELHDLSPDKKRFAVHTAHRIPRFGSPAFRLFGAVGTRNPVGPVATVFPEFIARDGQERANGCRQGGKRRVGAARRRSRGHGPARLDGTRARATVAVKVMKSGETAGQGNGLPPCADRTASEARRPGSGSRAGGVSRAERGNDGSPNGARRRRRLDALRARQRDRPSPRWPGTPSLQGSMSTRRNTPPASESGFCCGRGFLAEPAQPVRRLLGGPSIARRG